VRRRLPLVLGCVAIAATGTGLACSLAWLVARIQYQGAEEALMHRAESARSMLESRLERERARLLAARGFYLGSSDVKPSDWKAFASAMYGGENGGRTLVHLSYAPATRSDLAAAKIVPLGVPRKNLVEPKTPGDYYCVADRIWPARLRKQVLGQNPCAQGDRKLFTRALHENGMLVSRKEIIFGPGGELRPGLVLVSAEHVLSRDDVKQPGWVVETMPSSSMFRGLAGQGSDAVLRVFDLDGGAPRLMYRAGSRAHAQVAWWEAITGVARHKTVKLDFASGHRHWRLVFDGRAEIGWVPASIGGAGFIISLLLAALFYSVARTGRRAESMAETMTRDLSASRELLSSVTNNIRDGIYRGVPNSGLIYVNRSLAQLFGFGDETKMISNQGAIRYASPARRDELRDKLYAHGSYEDEEVEYVRADGSRFVGLNSAWAIRDEAERVRYYDGVVTDITDRKAAERQIEFMAHYDRLTGLPNRTLLEDRFHQAARSAARSGVLIAVLFIDLDNFKDINDLHGHDIGDLFLVEVAARLRDCVREHDTVARFGGDEFVVLASQIANVEAVTRIANQVVDVVSRSYEIAGLELHTTPSVGIALFPQDGSDLTTLSQNADAAMYQVKNRGRAGIAYFTQRLNEQARRQVAVENALRHAIERGELAVAFQPRALLADGRIGGVETLARWTHPEWGSIGPAEFIPAAERTGQIVALGEWVLARALTEWKRWAADGDPPTIGVNVSARQLRERRFAAAVERALKAADVPGEALELEITEGMLVERLQASEATLDDLKALGVRLALDDFGIGYSSLGYLKRFDIDVIKIDQSFVRDLLTDPNDAAIVRAIAAISRDLDVHLVAEGVETEAQLEALRQIRCEAVQGFLLAKPMGAGRFAEFLERCRKDGPPGPFRVP